jgi:DNA primase
MTGHIPESFIEELLSRVDIVEVIGGYVELRRTGANYVSRCPFHAEKTPSFTVSHSKQFYHCFGCGASGNALRFLTEHGGLHFVEAVEVLANRAGIPMPKEAQPVKEDVRTSAIYAMLAEAGRFFQHQLSQGAFKQVAVEYLKSRGITGKTAKEFNLGVAPPLWDGLIQALGKDSNAIENLMTAGLLISKENNRYYDRFRDRIMFPIRDRRGRIVGFGGRVINTGNPKYLNSPETIVFNKGQHVYGLYEAKLQNRSLNHLIVVEGYLDVLTLSQFGITQAVAILGTALTEKHIDVLFRQVNEVSFCFDSDTAGREASLKALHLCLPEMEEGRRVRFMMLPAAEDPDSFIRKNGKAAFLAKLNTSKSLSDFLFESVSNHLDLSSIEGRAELVRLSKPLLLKLPKGVFQSMMFERLEQLADLPSSSFQRRRSSFQPNRGGFSGPSGRNKRSLPVSPAVRALALLLENRTLLSYISDQAEFKRADTPGTSLLCAIIEILKMDPSIPLDEIEKRLASEEDGKKTSLTDLVLIAQTVPAEGIDVEFLGALNRLKERAQEQTMEVLLKQASIGQLSLEEKIELRELLGQKDKNGVD